MGVGGIRGNVAAWWVSAHFSVPRGRRGGWVAGRGRWVSADSGSTRDCWRRMGVRELVDDSPSFFRRPA